MYTEDANWVVNWCLKFITHKEAVTRRCAVQVLGNVAVLRAHKVDLRRCLKAAEQLRDDTDEEVKVAANDALADVRQGMKLQGASQS